MVCTSSSRSCRLSALSMYQSFMPSAPGGRSCSRQGQGGRRAPWAEPSPHRHPAVAACIPPIQASHQKHHNTSHPPPPPATTALTLTLTNQGCWKISSRPMRFSGFGLSMAAGKQAGSGGGGSSGARRGMQEEQRTAGPSGDVAPQRSDSRRPAFPFEAGGSVLRLPLGPPRAALLLCSTPPARPPSSPPAPARLPQSRALAPSLTLDDVFGVLGDGDARGVGDRALHHLLGQLGVGGVEGVVAIHHRIQDDA